MFFLVLMECESHSLGFVLAVCDWPPSVTVLLDLAVCNFIVCVSYMTHNKVEEVFIAVDFFFCVIRKGKIVGSYTCQWVYVKAEECLVGQWQNAPLLKRTGCSFAPSFEAAMSQEIGMEFKEAAAENWSSSVSSDRSVVEWCHGVCHMSTKEVPWKGPYSVTIKMYVWNTWRSCCNVWISYVYMIV
jgi:hypothetical protein